MPIIACGLNHKTAPIALREKVIFQSEKLPLYLQDLINEGVREAVLLSTCNRSEIYCDSDDAGRLFNWFCREHGLLPEEIQSSWYSFSDQAAVEHMMKVACGLDSMVLGEPQVLGQMKEAFSESCAAGCIGGQFNRLFQQIFAVAKEVRTNTSIGACPVSLASAAVNLAKQKMANPLSDATILLIGAGDTIQLVLRYLKTQSVKQIIIANRRVENIKELAEKNSAKMISFDELPQTLSICDLVISATGSTVPIITKKSLALTTQPLCIVDLAVPRDVDIAVSELSNINLFSIDDLKSIIQKNLNGREHAAEKAHDIIKLKSMEFMIWQNSLDQATAAIQAYRKQIENLSDLELTKAIRLLERGDDPAEVLIYFARALTNKILHHPSVQLRQAGMEGRVELLRLAQQLFTITE